MVTEHPLAAALAVFAIDFGVLLAIRVWERGAFYIPWGNKTFSIGDSVCLPAYAAFATLAVRRAPGRRPAKWWSLASVAGGLAVVVLLDMISIAQGHASVLASPAPSKAYHALIVPAVFWVLARRLPGVWAARGSRSSLLALAALACYFAISAMELHHSAGPTLRVAMAQVQSAATGGRA